MCGFGHRAPLQLCIPSSLATVLHRVAAPLDRRGAEFNKSLRLTLVTPDERCIANVAHERRRAAWRPVVDT